MTDHLKKGTDHGNQGESIPSCFFCLFGISSHRLRFPFSPSCFTVGPCDVPTLLTLAYCCLRGFRADVKRMPIGDSGYWGSLIGSRATVGRSPGHLDRVSPDPIAPTGEQLQESSKRTEFQSSLWDGRGHIPSTCLIYSLGTNGSQPTAPWLKTGDAPRLQPRTPSDHHGCGLRHNLLDSSQGFCPSAPELPKKRLETHSYNTERAPELTSRRQGPQSLLPSCIFPLG